VVLSWKMVLTFIWRQSKRELNDKRPRGPGHLPVPDKKDLEVRVCNRQFRRVCAAIAQGCVDTRHSSAAEGQGTATARARR